MHHFTLLARFKEWTNARLYGCVARSPPAAAGRDEQGARDDAKPCRACRHTEET